MQRAARAGGLLLLVALLLVLYFAGDELLARLKRQLEALAELLAQAWESVEEFVRDVIETVVQAYEATKTWLQRRWKLDGHIIANGDGKGGPRGEAVTPELWALVQRHGGGIADLVDPATGKRVGVLCADGYRTDTGRKHDITPIQAACSNRGGPRLWNGKRVLCWDGTEHPAELNINRS